MSFFADLRNLDRNNIGGWPNSIKIFFAVLIIAFIVFMGWWFKISDQQDALEAARGKETQLKQEFSGKQARVANLDAYRTQLAVMQEQLDTMKNQLPSRTEMPRLLIDISEAALSSGIQTELFQPGPEVPKDFYAEKPITLKMLGTYHQFGAFMANVASLRRVVILTMHDVSLKPAGKEARTTNGTALALEGVVKTYRSLDEDETAAANAAAAKKKKGGK
jgi:type IV pilus assembly protein PilO